MALDDSDNPLAIEIRQEAAESYFAACKKMVDALAMLEAFDRAVASPSLDSQQTMRRSELLEEAAERVYFVIIQRESMRLLCSELFFESYGVPEEVRKPLGPRQGK